jgi:hypothetical protein
MGDEMNTFRQFIAPTAVAALFASFMLVPGVFCFATD